MAEKPYSVVFAKPSDAKEIVDFFNAAGAESVNMSFGENEYRFNVTEEEENLIKMAKENNEVRILVRDNKSGELLATGSTYRLDRRSKHVFELGIVVRKKNWRQGIGRAMMERLHEEAKKLGAERMVLDMNADNGPALRLYESMGYEVEGRLRKQLKIRDQYVDLVVMGLLLN